jgi:hypothetical protein
MTIFEGYSRLIAWFSEKDYFNYPKDIKSLLLVSVDTNDSIVIKKSLDKLCEDGLVVSEICASGDIVFILNKKLEQLDQEIKINGITALEISKRINWFCEDVMKEDSDVCDPINIQQKDIHNLIHILDFLKKTLDTEKKEE